MTGVTTATAEITATTVEEASTVTTAGEMTAGEDQDTTAVATVTIAVEDSTTAGLVDVEGMMIAAVVTGTTAGTSRGGLAPGLLRGEAALLVASLLRGTEGSGSRLMDTKEN